MMEVVLAIVLFIAVCAALMVWDYYKPARFRTTYQNVNQRHGTNNSTYHSGGGDSGGSFYSSDCDGGGGD